MEQILIQAKAQGYDKQSFLKQWQINKLFDDSISTGIIQRQFPREMIQDIWAATQKNQDGQVLLGEFLQSMQKKNKLQYMPSKKDETQNSNNQQNSQRQSGSVRVQQYDENERGSNRDSNLNNTSVQNINATINQSLAPTSSIITSQKQYNTPSKKTKSPKKNKKSNQKQQQLKRPLIIYHQSEPTQQQIEDSLVKDIPRPKLKGSIVSKKSSSIQKKSTNAGSVDPNQSSSVFMSSVQTKENQVLLTGKQQNSKKKCISKRWLIPMCLFVLGLIVFMSSFIIHTELKKLAIQQVILGPDNEGIWAHFPGDTKAQIDRNWTFFNITNADNMLFYNQKPKFRQVSGFKIVQQEDYLNITYIEDGDRVQMIDWLHFSQQSETRNLDQKVKVLNVGGLAYWYNIKVARPTIILQQGLSLLFTTLQDSILPNIYAQAINMQFLPDFNDDIYSMLFAPASISFQQAVFIWQDPAYGIGKQDNLKYWLAAISSKEEEKNETVAEGFLFLRSYFTLRTQQLSFIIAQLKSYVEFTQSAVLENNYCQNTEQCTGRYLAYQQFSQSFVTRNPPPGKDIQANDTICMSNTTCEGYFPELQAFYRNVYLERYPERNSTLSFEAGWMKNIIDYNKSIDQKFDYNTAQDCLFHIGNLDALWDNGTLYDQAAKEFIEKHHEDEVSLDAFENKNLKNIQQRFKLPSSQHAQVFWQWIKYLNNELILRNQTNQQLGVGNLFATGLYSAFSYLQDNLQPHLLVELIDYEIVSHGNLGDCATFIQQSLQLNQREKALKICDAYGQKIEKSLIKDLLSLCSIQYRQQWWQWRNKHELKSVNMLSLCDFDNQNNDTFGSMLHKNRKYLNQLYKCDITPKQYCSDYELAAIQWTSGQVTLNPPKQLAKKDEFSSSYTYNSWNPSSKRFQYAFYKSKYPKRTEDFPEISIKQAYEMLNFDHWFSASVMLKNLVDEQFDQEFKNYMRYIGIQVGLNGLTMERSPRQLIFGYEDDILKQIKEMYPPFGGDPSTPSLIAFNDPNITKQEASLTLQWSTGKYNSSLVGQYRKINGFQYLTVQKDFFNGNTTTTLLQSPWQGEDYVYGTSAKQFAPNQFDQPNISLYVPNIQRYGSGVIDSSSTIERFGFDLQLGYLGESIYESSSQSDENKKYYQNFHAIFNQTSVVGFPLFVCKNHFMNVTSNWSSLVEIWDQNETVHYQQASQYDDSFVVVQPYTGVSFQSTVYLQSNYYHTHDELIKFYTRSLLPIFSLARSGNITEEVANGLLGPLRMGLSVVKWTKIVGIVIVVVACIICGVIYYHKKRNQKDNLEQSDDDKTVSEQSLDTPKKSPLSLKRPLNYSQLGISLQPMSSDKPLAGQQTEKKQKYNPPPVIEEEI